MARYRILRLDGRYAAPPFIEADDDAAALTLFAQRGEQGDCEILCGRRKVAFIPTGAEPIRALGRPDAGPSGGRGDALR